MKYLPLLLALPALAQAATVFDGYEAYYATLPDAAFHGKGFELEPFSLDGDDAMRLQWHGVAAGRPQKLELREGQLKINGRPLNLQRVTAFPDETPSDTDLGHGTKAYFAKAWTCIENTPSSASGTAVRHKAVYLIKQAGKRQDAWKLPSLFASCAGVRLESGAVRFDKAEYKYPQGQDEPSGVLFKEYTIQGKRFLATGGVRSVRFIEPGNVYKFSVDSQ